MQAEFGLDTGALGRNLLYKPAWSCEQVLHAWRTCNGLLWHPVKQRGCLVDYLESNPDNVGGSCVGFRMQMRTGRDGAAPPQLLWVGEANGTRLRYITGNPVAVAALRSQSMLMEGNWGPGVRHILSQNGTLVNYG